MKIIGFSLSKISADKKEKFQEKIQINQDIDIKDVIKEKIPISEDEILRINFVFTIKYSGDFAKLEFGGNILVLPEKDELKEFIKAWKDKQVPQEFRAFLFNFIMNKCNIKALSLEDELNLPLHLPLPRINQEQPNP